MKRKQFNLENIRKYLKKNEKSTTEIANYFKLGSGYVNSILNWYYNQSYLNKRIGKPNICYWKQKNE